ncbi:hypothetical protein [Methylobacterium durans]|nr:hypothetical protein [Methylobacterium durans]
MTDVTGRVVARVAVAMSCRKHDLFLDELDLAQFNVKVRDSEATA